MQEEVLMDNELLVEMKIDFVILHNLKLNEGMNSFFDIIEMNFVEFYHYEKIDLNDVYLLISLKDDDYFD
jgi:hypothetical protein